MLLKGSVFGMDIHGYICLYLYTYLSISIYICKYICIHTVHMLIEWKNSSKLGSLEWKHGDKWAKCIRCLRALIKRLHRINAMQLGRATAQRVAGRGKSGYAGVCSKSGLCWATTPWCVRDDDNGLLLYFVMVL